MKSRTLLPIAVGMIAAVAVLQSTRGGTVRVPDPKPATERIITSGFEARSLDGRILNLSSYRGKVLVINYWAPWCAPCRREMPALASVANDFAGRGVAVLGIALESKEESVREYTQSAKLPFDVAMPLGVTGADVLALPTTVIVDRQGRVAQRVAGEVHEGSLRSLLDKLVSEPAQ